MSEPIDEARERIKSVHNERAKLSATYLNGIAIATFAVGSLTIPFNSMAQAHPSGSVSAIALICAAASLALHFPARFLLRSLQ